MGRTTQKTIELTKNLLTKEICRMNIRSCMMCMRFIEKDNIYDYNGCPGVCSEGKFRLEDEGHY
jgi:hypothetical protein